MKIENWFGVVGRADGTPRSSEVSGCGSLISSLRTPHSSLLIALFFIFHFSFLLFTSCAKQGFPSGGPKDVTPPVALGCKPQNESRNFTGSQFYIQFDEYVTLKNAENNVIISPPMAQKPEFGTRGKGVLVRLKDTLQANTTYIFQFKETIADFNEGNLLPSFEYVFSTGPTMDSLMLAGKVENARDGKPWKETVTVLAFRGADTVPAFVTRADKDGRFAFHHIPSGDYRLVAIEDRNRDLKVADAEPAGWLEETFPAVDSVDSLHTATLRLSAPDRRKQRVLKSEMPERGRIRIITAAPMRNPVVTGEQNIMSLNPKGDTLTVWCINPQCDSTVIVLSDDGLQDTLRLRYRKPRPRRGATQSATPPLMSSLCDGQKAWFDDLRLAFRTPVRLASDTLFARVMSLKDSIVSRCRVLPDSSGLKARIDTVLAAGESYRISIPAGMFADLYGNRNDSLAFNAKPRDYAILTLQIERADSSAAPLLVELLDQRDTVVAVKPLAGSGSLRFDHVSTGEYRLRAVFDADGNGRWTGGDYLLRRQPERFVLYGKALKLRERWEMEEKLRIEN